MPATDPASELFGNPVFVGREEELGRLAALLDRAPALGVVRGGRASGKTSLVAAFGRRAAAGGWRVIAPPPVGREVARQQLVRTLRELAGLPTTFAEPAGDAQGDRLLGAGAEAKARSPAVQQAGETLPDGLARRRTVVILDGYRASPDVERWLLGELLAELRSAGAPVVTLVAGGASEVRGVAEHADDVVEAGLPSEADVRRHLGAVGALLSPPAHQEEVDALAGAVTSQPQLIGPLVRALGHARADA